MRLLFILSEYLPQSGGGIISYYAGVLPYLVLAGHEVRVLVAATDFLDQPDRLIDGVRVSYLQSESLNGFSGRFARFRHGYPAISAFLPVAWAGWQQVRGGEGYDLVETTDFPMLYAPWVACTSEAPVNISLHGSPGQLDWFDCPKFPTLDADLLRLVERAAFTMADSIQANSEANAHFWGGLSRREVPVLLPSFSSSNSSLSGNRSTRHGIVVGRLQRWKGPQVLCKALEELPEVTVRWVGKDVTDPQTGRMYSLTLVSEYPQVFGTRLLHEKPMAHGDVHFEIANAEFLCVPSTWDVFNLTVVEAMALGTPVICSTAAGASMLIRHGENGYLFDPQEPAQLVAAIRLVRELDPVKRDRLTVAARQTVRERMDPQTLASERIHFYQGLIKSPVPRAADAWLGSMLSPREMVGVQKDLLGSFTSLELLEATARQVANGILRQIGG